MKWRLRLMMLLEYAIWGAWYVTVGTWLGKTLHFSGQEIGAIAGTTAIGAMISPLFVGLLTDRPQQLVSALTAQTLVQTGQN